MNMFQKPTYLIFTVKLLILSGFMLISSAFIGKRTTALNPQVALIDLPAKEKVDTVLAKLKTLQNEISDEEFLQIKNDTDILFSPSGYINLETKEGEALRLTRAEFLDRTRGERADYQLIKSTLVHYDLFRENALGKRFCRSTTYHDVIQFEKEMPVSEKVTSVQRKPVIAKAPTANEDYWQIIELTLKEN